MHYNPSNAHLVIFDLKPKHRGLQWTSGQNSLTCDLKMSPLSGFGSNKSQYVNGGSRAPTSSPTCGNFQVGTKIFKSVCRIAKLAMLAKVPDLTSFDY